MSYPMRKAVTPEELEQELQAYGVSLVQEQFTHRMGDGADDPLWFFSREDDGKTLRAVIDPQAPPLGGYEVRAICTRLGIDPREIEGLSLG